MGEDQSRWIPLEQEIRYQFSIMSQKHSVALDCELHGLEIYAEPLIGRVFYNLMHNAIRHGKNLTRISFRGNECDDGVVVTCEDDGAGIAPEKKGVIFERLVSGSGKFGLFFVREFLDIAGMKISETGVFGKGARFEILIPKGLYRYPSPT